MIHQKRREELLSMLGRDAVVIVSTNSEQKRNSDVTYPFRPDSNFWYLTGFTEPDAIAVFSKESYVMFLRPKDETKEIWNGIRLGVALAPETLLVDQLMTLILSLIILTLSLRKDLSYILMPQEVGAGKTIQAQIFIINAFILFLKAV